MDLQQTEILRLASQGVPTALIHRLCGMPRQSLKSFERLYRSELQRGQAEADAAVMTALHELAKSGKSIQATLAWAKERLGWQAEEGRQTDDSSAVARASAQNGLALLQTLLDEIARSKAGHGAGAVEMAGDGAAQPTAAIG